MAQQPQSVSFNLPLWIEQYIHDVQHFESLESRMAFVIEAARLNVLHHSGGPFAAGVFDQKSGELIALGVNVVTHENLSTLHAEMVAMMLAQRKLGSYTLQNSATSYQLVSSAEPCAMCLGAIVWSGISEVVSGATDADVRAIGFDEGPKPHNWEQALMERNISVSSAFSRAEAIEVLQFYAHNGGIIYNSKAL